MQSSNENHSPVETSTPRPEQPRRQLEIIHNEHTDVVINHASPEGELRASAVADSWKDGVPVDWQKYETSDSKDNLVVGQVNDHRYLAKRRIHAVREQGHIDAVRAVVDEPHKRQLLAVNSVVNELKMAPLIAETMMSTGVQQQMTELGATSFQYVEPIVAVVDRSSENNTDGGRFANKYVIYPFIKNATPGGEPFFGEAPPPGYTFDEATAGKASVVVREALSQAGITPNDLAYYQFLQDRDGGVYLIDAEGYVEDKPHLTP